jgi:transcriptional regulator with XRE-family HTH domain
LKVPDRVGDLGGYLKEQRESARLSLRQLASVAGVSNPYLSQIERGLRKPSAEVLQQIAKGLQISAEALFLRAGLLEESGGVEVEVAIQSDRQLTARQKRVLLDIYSTFRAENARAVQESAAKGVPVEPIDPSALAVEVAMADTVADTVAEAPAAPANVVPLKSAAGDAEGAKRPRKRAAKKATKSTRPARRAE